MNPDFELRWLLPCKTQEVKDFLGLYESAFPLEEIEPVEQILEEIATEGHGFYSASCYLSGVFCGIVRMHLFIKRKSALLVHIAVAPEFEGQGIGSKLLIQTAKSAQEKGCDRWLFAEMDPVILEDSRRVRRHDWFKRNGFQLVTKDYVQPSLRAGCPEVPLWLLAKSLSDNPGSVEPQDIQAIMDDVYENTANYK